MPRVVHFAIHAEDPARMARFYSEVFGWIAHPCGGPEDYWVLSTGPDDEPGIDGGVMKCGDGAPHVVSTILVDSIDAFCAKIERSGGEIVAPKKAVPGVGYNASCKDPEGILFSIHQPDPDAE